MYITHCRPLKLWIECRTLWSYCHLTMSAHVGQCIVICVICIQLHDRCWLMEPRQSSTRSFNRAWTTVTRSYMASPTICSGVCRQSQTQQQAWLSTLEEVITLHRSCGSYIGYQRVSGWNLSSMSWSSRFSTTWHYTICQMIAAFGRHHRLQSDSFKCLVTSTSSRLGNCAFSAAVPRIWNSLPTLVRQLDMSLDSFYRKLKTYFVI